MPWVSLEELRQIVIKNLQEKHGSLHGITPYEVDTNMSTYPKRVKKCCESLDCDCVVFGLMGEYSPEYEYYV